MQKMIEKLHMLWVPVIGVAFIVYGTYQFLELKALEAVGQVVRLPKAFQVLYDMGGKYTLLVAFIVAGCACLFMGIRQLRDEQ